MTLSNSLLNTDWLGTSTTPLRNLFQCLTMLLVKKCFLISPMNVHWHSFESFLHDLSLDIRNKSSAPPSTVPLLRSWREASQLPFLRTRQTQSRQMLLMGRSFFLLLSSCFLPEYCLKKMLNQAGLPSPWLRLIQVRSSNGLHFFFLKMIGIESYSPNLIDLQCKELLFP